MPLSDFRSPRRRLDDSHVLHKTQATPSPQPQVVVRETLGWTDDDRTADCTASESWICAVAAHNHVVELALDRDTLPRTEQMSQRDPRRGRWWLLVAAVVGGIIGGYPIVGAIAAGYSWSERDWNLDGHTTAGEYFAAMDIGKRPAVRGRESCREFFALKDGMPIRYDCPSGRFRYER